MIQNIFVGILIVIAIGAGIWGWWSERGNTKEKEEITQEKEINKEN
jgi:uncharacterized protein HemX